MTAAMTLKAVDVLQKLGETRDVKMRAVLLEGARCSASTPSWEALPRVVAAPLNCEAGGRWKGIGRNGPREKSASIAMRGFGPEQNWKSAARGHSRSDGVASTSCPLHSKSMQCEAARPIAQSRAAARCPWSCHQGDQGHLHLCTHQPLCTSQHDPGWEARIGRPGVCTLDAVGAQQSLACCSQRFPLHLPTVAAVQPSSVASFPGLLECPQAGPQGAGYWTGPEPGLVCP